MNNFWNCFCFKNILLLLVLCQFGTLISSCAETEAGCTDPQSTSYNPNAEEDDGSCTYFRDSYLGTFRGFSDSSTDDWDSDNVIVKIEPEPNEHNKVLITRSFNLPDGTFQIFTITGQVTDRKISFNHTEVYDIVVLRLCGPTGFPGKFQSIGVMEFSEDLNKIEIKSGFEKAESADGMTSCTISYTAAFERE